MTNGLPEPMITVTSNDHESLNSNDVQRAPSILRHLHSLAASPGAPLYLKCELEAEANLQIEWSFNGKPISMNPDERFICKATLDDVLTTTLETEALQLEDSGIFECRFSNEFGTAFSVAQIFVRAPTTEEINPDFVKYPPSVNAVESGPIHIECSFSSPVSTVIWMVNGTEAPPDALIEIDAASRQVVILSLPAMSADLFGVHTVQGVDGNSGSLSPICSFAVSPTSGALLVNGGI
ncbi:unnamed protein product [Protopolystoma xenopodis]|uniref:Ig-like domain-containing protein n=1 Tax=Protopolystoma xenopodis TaxID=117903 RepID=A0A448XBE7_9PLAT|nr:unnamed protein product [Protopolystoma xenopodis]